MGHIKRIGSICLTVAFLISAMPFNIQATELINDLNGETSSTQQTGGTGGDTHGNAGNNDGTGQQVAGGGDFCTVEPGGGTIGVRFSIIDPNNPTEVIGVLLDGSTGVVDILYSQNEFWEIRSGYQNTKLESNYTFSSIKTQDLWEINKIDRYFIEDFHKMVEAVRSEDPTIKMGDMPRWMDFNASASAYRMNGTAFKNWFWTNSAGEVVDSSHSLYNTEINAQGQKQTIPKATEEKNSTKKNNQTTTNVKTPKKPQTKVSEESAKLVTSYSDKINSVYDVLLGQVAKGVNISTIYRNATNRFSQLRTEISYLSKYGKLEDSSKQVLDRYLDQEIDRVDNWYKAKQKLQKRQTSLNKIESLFGVITAYADMSTGKKGEILPPGESPPVGEVPEGLYPELGDTDTEADASKVNKDANIKTLLRFKYDLTDGNGNNLEEKVPIFRLIDTDGQIKALNDETIQRKWILVVEPIVYLTTYRGGSSAQPKDVLHQKIYGTISNIADYLGKDPRIKRAKTFNYKAIQHQAWGALTLDTTTILDSDIVKSTGMEINLLNDQGETTFTFMNLDMPKHHRADGTVNTPRNPGSYQTFEDLAYYNNLNSDNMITDSSIPVKTGYGVNIYWGNVFSNPPSSIITWDKDNYPEGDPAPAPDASDRLKYPLETSYGEDANKFKIVKFYYLESGEITDNLEMTEEMLVDVQTRKDTPHVITIKNEGDLESDYYWQVQKWATGKEDIAPESGDLSKHFEDYVNSNLGEQAGYESAIVTIPPESEDKVLYVKLVMKEIQRPILDVVKVYEDGNIVEKVEVESEPVITDNKYKVKIEDGEYTYAENAKTPEILIDEPKSWDDVPEGSTKGHETDIVITEDISTIYIRYTKVKSVTGNINPIILHEDELAFPYSMDDLK